jgi:hypothetical protein
MYVLGGHHGAAMIASVLKFDSTQGTWIQVAPMPAARCAFATCAIGSDIYVFGGTAGDGRLLTSVFKFDMAANEWSALAPMRQASAYHSASVVDGLVYIVGAGASGRDVMRFDPSSGAWSWLASTSTSRQFGASFVLNGCLYAAGGDSDDGSQRSYASVERYDVASDKWTAVANMWRDVLPDLAPLSSSPQAQPRSRTSLPRSPPRPPGNAREFQSH